MYFSPYSTPSCSINTNGSRDGVDAVAIGVCVSNTEVSDAEEPSQARKSGGSGE